MNLHEECLLKYLLNPLDLFYTTELLKQNNNFIEQNFYKTNPFEMLNKAKLCHQIRFHHNL